ncbi:SCO2525 family SAM-dependent methyltransferase [Streptomyces sp. NPDC047043]|uniref:SCO2525 family SAM-dependent methyltransferase n=1 Tax=Streptomyces sp. NPDC047043 TaxID=3154497 RepID=UPI0033E167F0
MHLGSPGNLSQLNAEAPWGDFDPKAYVKLNYEEMQSEDRKIIAIVRTHFGDHFRADPDRPVRGIDVGAGANLYPAFSMLPWCDEITLLDRAGQNIDYLKRQRGRDGYDPVWDAFWDLFCEDEAYAALPGDPRTRFTERTRVEEGDLFALSSQRGHWSLGTMFFVAESLSTSHDEFWQAVECFLLALTPGAPFAAAFMEHSEGYFVKDTHFPACDVGELEIRSAVEAYAEPETLIMSTVGKPNAVRDGYTSMIVACGFRGRGN